MGGGCHLASAGVAEELSATQAPYLSHYFMDVLHIYIFFFIYTLLIPFGKFVFVTQQTSTFESHFLTHMQGVAGAYHKLIACSWVPMGKLLGYNMAWLGIEPATTRSRVRRANHSATLAMVMGLVWK